MTSWLITFRTNHQPTVTPDTAPRVRNRQYGYMKWIFSGSFNMMIPWPMVSNHLEILCLDRKVSFKERCYHSDKCRTECVPRHTKSHKMVCQKMGFMAQIMGNLASCMPSFWRCSKHIRRLRNLSKFHQKKIRLNLLNLVFTSLFDHEPFYQ